MLVWTYHLLDVTLSERIHNLRDFCHHCIPQVLSGGHGIVIVDKVLEPRLETFGEFTHNLRKETGKHDNVLVDIMTFYSISFHFGDRVDMESLPIDILVSKKVWR